MKILILYGTSEGQTRKIARYMEEVLQQENHQVVIADTTEEPPNVEDYDAIIVGSSIHVHRYQNSVRDYVVKNVAAMNKKYSALFTVSLSIASKLPKEQQELTEIESIFLAQTGWKPNKTIQIAGALRYTQYDYFKKLIMQLIAKKEGSSTDTSADKEYTDWPAVKKFVLDFAAEKKVTVPS